MSLLLPQWLWLLLFVGISLLYHYRTTGNIQIQKRFLWLLLAMMMLIIAMSRPVLSRKSVEVEQLGSDIVVALDLSRSMQADDIKPTRLKAAKVLLKRLVYADLKNRFGVIGFTTNAIVLSPLTNDAPLLVHLFEGVDENMIMTKGSALMPALELSRKMSRAKAPMVLLLSDGGDQKSYADEAAYAKKSGLVVHIVMLASRKGTTLDAGEGTLLKDANGNIVITAQNRAIQVISDVTGGTFIEGDDLQAVEEAIAQSTDKAYRSRTKVEQYEELFYYFMMLSTLFFIFAATSVMEKLQQWTRWRRK